jgi:hypothetical protein
MKIVLTNPGRAIDRGVVSEVARRGGFNATDVRVVNGGSLKVAVEYDEANESRPRKGRILELVSQAGGPAISRGDVSVTPRWAASLLIR